MVSLFKFFRPIILQISKPQKAPPYFFKPTIRILTNNYSQDKISSLSLKKRTIRKKREEQQQPLKPGLYSVVAFATAEEYNLEALITGLKGQNLYEPGLIENNPDVVHAVAKYQVNSEPREIFFFREGSVILWNISDLESSNVLNFLKTYEHDGYSDVLIQGECEFMNYKYQEEG